MSDTEPTLTEAEVIAELGALANESEKIEPGTANAFVLREGQHIEQVDGETLLDRPRRRRGTSTALDADSFSRLVVDLGPEHGRTTIYADISTLTLTGLLNDHETAGQAGWGDHRVVLPIVRTAQWSRWLSLNDKLGEQTVFAQHIEENMADIVDPPGADLLELAQSFEATTSAQFKSAARLKDGARQLVYAETIDARAGREGQIVIPEGFTLKLAPFEGADEVSVLARLRYRISGGRLAIGYQLHQPKDIERAAFDSVVEKVGGATKVPPYRAKPPTS
jgi:uncharacterized protein YfdQ (DUF2303 family)